MDNVMILSPFLVLIRIGYAACLSKNYCWHPLLDVSFPSDAKWRKQEEPVGQRCRCRQHRHGVAEHRF
ncbi:hypothetical protein [Prevotella sp. khp7]|uniref:hypothetical protein n=1 Tax=Prevotella sp. khp7 TaxID=1761885 RepID=UPI00115FB4D2|nr:hypothetical protein [Prevotella sp. khp7]